MSDKATNELKSEELKKYIDDATRALLSEQFGDVGADEIRKMQADLRTMSDLAQRMENWETGAQSGTTVLSTRNGSRTFNEGYAKRANAMISRDPLGGAGLELARFYRAIAAEHLAKGTKKAKDIALGWGDRWLADSLDRASDGETLGRARALGVELGSIGGYVIPEEQDSQIIDLLYAKSVFMSLNPNVVPMVSTRMGLPVLKTGVSTSWVGESQQTNAGQPSFGMRYLDMHKTVTIVPLSHEWAMMASPQADALVRRNMVRSMALAHDLKFIRGDGTANTPKGLKALCPAANSNNITAPAGSTYTAREVKKEIRNNLIEKIEGADVDIDSLGFIKTSRTKNALASLTDSNNNPVFEAEIARGQLMGHNFGVSNQIPKNLDASTDGTNDETEIYAAAFDEVYVGQMQGGTVIQAYDGATYRDSGGTLVSGLSNDEIVLKVRGFAGMQVGHEEAIAMLEAVDYYTTI